MKTEELLVKKYKDAERLGGTCGSDGNSEFSISLQLLL